MELAVATTRYFDFHGTSISVANGIPESDTAVSSLLGRFETELNDTPDAVRITLASATDTHALGDRIPLSASLLYSNRPGGAPSDELGLAFDVYQVPDTTIVDLGDNGMLTFRREAGTAELLLADDSSLHPDIVGSLLLYTLSELLKPYGFHLLHAAAVSCGDAAVLIPGTQGRGKTTTCLALLAHGYAFLSDDVIFLREQDSRIYVCAVPEPVSVTDTTIEMFPQLRTRPELLHEGLLKRHADAATLFDSETVLRARPALIVFPEVTGEPDSTLDPVARPRALEWLLPRGVSVLDRSDSRASFQMLSKLVAQSACYRLRFGTHVGAVGPLVDTALTGLE
jgi:hypothetical protein